MNIEMFREVLDNAQLYERIVTANIIKYSLIMLLGIIFLIVFIVGVKRCHDKLKTDEDDFPIVWGVIAVFALSACLTLFGESIKHLLSWSITPEIAVINYIQHLIK